MNSIKWGNTNKKQLSINDGISLMLNNDTDWVKISGEEYILSEEFIRKFQDVLDWINISCYQILSENFILEFKDKICWDSISSSQILSEDFIKKYQYRLDWDWISSNQLLTIVFIEEFKDKIDFFSLFAFNDKINFLTKTRLIMYLNLMEIELNFKEKIYNLIFEIQDHFKYKKRILTENEVTPFLIMYKLTED